MKRASYRHAVEWIALNDAARNDDAEATIAEYMSAALVADLFGVDTTRVAHDVFLFKQRPSRPTRVHTLTGRITAVPADRSGFFVVTTDAPEPYLETIHLRWADFDYGSPQLGDAVVLRYVVDAHSGLWRAAAAPVAI